MIGGLRARAGVPGTERFGLWAAPAGVVVEVHDLLEVIWVSLVAGIGFVTAGSLAIFGVARANSARREGHALAATAYGTVAVLGALVCTAGVVVGVSVMLSKG